MTLKTFKGIALAAILAAAGLAALATPSAAFAQAKEQFFPLLVYRTGAYAPNGTPWANGKHTLTNHLGNGLDVLAVNGPQHERDALVGADLGEHPVQATELLGRDALTRRFYRELDLNRTGGAHGLSVRLPWANADAMGPDVSGCKRLTKRLVRSDLAELELLVLAPFV